MTLTFDWTIEVGGVDVTALGLVKGAGTIDYGRTTRDNGFQAPRARFQLYTDAGYPQFGGSWPTIALGDEVLIHVTWDGITQWRRHTGVVQAIDWTRDEVTITSVGLIADYAHRVVGDTGPWAPITTENDYDRVERFLTGVSPALTIEGSAGRWVRQIPINTPGQSMLDALIRIADDCEALLLEDRLGVPRYRTRNFTKPSLYTLPVGCVQSTGLQMSTERGDIINSVAVYYGEPKPETGLQRYAYDLDSVSVAAIGERRAEIVTDLQFSNPDLVTGAAGKARQYLAEHAEHWDMPDVPVLMWTLEGSEADDLLDLQEGWPIRVTTLPAGAPMETYDGDVIGFTDIMHDTDYRMILHLAPTIEPEEEEDESPIYPDGIITGYNTTGTVDDGLGREWRWCKWTTTGAVTIDYDGPVLCEIVQQAGGAGGGAHSSSFFNGGGGGAGGHYHATQLFNPGYWPVDVGTGGAVNTDGGDTWFYGARMYGGGRGGDSVHQDGNDGGSGGGAFSDQATHALGGTPGDGVTGMGFDGTWGGGGAGGPGSGTYPNGGPGSVVTIAGATTTYAIGGSAGANDTPPVAGTGTGGHGGNIVWAAVAGATGSLTLQYRIA